MIVSNDSNFSAIDFFICNLKLLTVNYLDSTVSVKSQQTLKAAVKHGISQLVDRGAGVAVFLHMLWQLDDDIQRASSVKSCI